MIALLFGSAVLLAGLAGLWLLHTRERPGDRGSNGEGTPSSLIRYLAFGLGWVCALVATCLGAAVVFFAYADLAGG